MNWQQIETAPHDVSLIVYGTRWGSRIPRIPRIMLARCWPALGGGQPEGWFEEADNFDLNVIPTHWMPLPGAPSDE